jgi:Bacterial tandem repeat domain 1
MTISRRVALGCASAFALTGSSLAGVAKRAVLVRKSPASAPSAAQRFLELLVDPDENGGTGFSSMIWIAAPDTAWHAMSSLNDLAYRVANSSYKKRGYRLRRVSAFRTRAGIRYAACWEYISGPDWHSRHAMTQAQFDSARAEFASKGFRMTHADSRAGFAGIWERGDPSTQQVVTALTATEYQTQMSALAAQGYRPVRIAGAAVNGVSRYTGIFESGLSGGWQAHPEMTLAQLRKTEAALTAQGFRMTDASGHMLNGKPSFSGVWQKA